MATIVTMMGYVLWQQSYLSLIRQIQNRLTTKQPFTHITTLNPEIMVRATPDMAHWLKQSWVCVADGIGVCLLARRLGIRVPRLTGIDLAMQLIQSGVPVYCLGATDVRIQAAVDRCRELYSSATIVGYSSGYTVDDDWDSIVSELNKQPTFILVGMGFPLQERLAAEIPFGVAMGVGGMFDVVSGSCRRAPRWIQIVGLEWVYRAIREPVRLKRWRYLVSFLKFFICKF
jgi:N-acetylglucosaminyldiphosphoundecaprenol N-acetyl-beta-D-mannosaminyltransferase